MSTIRELAERSRHRSLFFDRAQSERAATLAALLPFVSAEARDLIIEEDEPIIDYVIQRLGRSELGRIMVTLPAHAD